MSYTQVTSTTTIPCSITQEALDGIIDTITTSIVQEKASDELLDAFFEEDATSIREVLAEHVSINDEGIVCTFDENSQLISSGDDYTTLLLQHSGAPYAYGTQVCDDSRDGVSTHSWVETADGKITSLKALAALAVA
tara:strand:+ start:119 stop:529 length:411 start_codon:yes stop_codon:yes gene_type:complete